jgi:hypothetical protein
MCNLQSIASYEQSYMYAEIARLALGDSEYKIVRPIMSFFYFKMLWQTSLSV